ncbi:hypothetical protein SDC9_177781 [bioreactor metagenome]|uniref:Uncharacterized protein n=1 Tax=bioreactor metagenome TaxID=1076179 RepID=A0A645GVE5_9ZZZZ
MGAILIRGIWVLLKFEFARAHLLQPPPIGFIAEFREIADRCLRLRHRRALRGGDFSRDGLIDPIARLHGIPAGRGVFAVAHNTHAGDQLGSVTVIIELPPALVDPISILIVAVPHPILLPPWAPYAPAC